MAEEKPAAPPPPEKSSFGKKFFSVLDDMTAATKAKLRSNTQTTTTTTPAAAATDSSSTSSTTTPSTPVVVVAATDVHVSTPGPVETPLKRTSGRENTSAVSEQKGVEPEAQEDVIHMLKDMVAKDEEEIGTLRGQIVQLQKDVEFWKNESFAQVAATPDVVSKSEQYKKLQREMRDEKKKKKTLEEQLEMLTVELARTKDEASTLAQQLKTMQGLEAEVDEAKKLKANAEELLSKSQLEQRDLKARCELISQEKNAMQRERDELEREKQKWLDEKVEMEKKVMEALEKVQHAQQQEEKQVVEDHPPVVMDLDHRHVDANELRCLQRDREMMAEQLYDALKKLAAAQAGCPKCAGQMRKSRDAAAPAASKPVIQASAPVSQILPPAAPLDEADLVLQRRFSLPGSERQISVHGCSYGVQHGFMYLTNHYLCFGTSAVTSFFAKKDLVIELKDIVALEKSGKTHLSVILLDGRKETLIGLRHRKIASLEIYNTAEKMGCSIRFLRDGRPDESSGILKEDDFELM